MILNIHTDKVTAFLSFLVIFSLALFSKLNALSIYLLCIYSLLYIVGNKKIIINRAIIWLTASFFLVHLLQAFFVVNHLGFWFEIEKKLAFIILPFFWCNLPINSSSFYINRTLRLFVYGMAFLGFCLIINACYLFYFSGDVEVFFYHNLVSLNGGNAIYYSLLFLISLIALFDKSSQFSGWKKPLLITIHVALIVLLSSKVFVFLTLFISLFYLSRLRYGLVSIIAGLIVLLVVKFFSPDYNVVQRYSDINISSPFSLKETITETTHFDGFSLRKELWKMGIEIGNSSRKNILIGAGPGDAQDLLNQKIIDKGFYIGSGKKEDTGYLNYNFHNQYIQSYVEVGALGILILMLIITYLIYVGIKRRNNMLILANVVFLISFLTESFLSRQIGIVFFLSFNLLLLQQSSANWKSFVKRIFDIVFSLIIIIGILTWLVPLLGIIIWIDTGSFPVFLQKRMGADDKAFNCLKMRTMIKNGEANNLPAQEADKRITKLGAFLRKYAIDEFPQFFNVLMGSMSVVGPRPLMITEEKLLNSVVEGFSSRLVSKPGVTGLSQANGYKGIIADNADVRVRYRLDTLYAKKQNFWVDLKIIVRTITYLFNKH